MSNLSNCLSLSFIILCIAIGARAQPGFEEEMLPDIFKVHGNVKMVDGRSYRPQSFGDTLGKGVLDGKTTWYYDKKGRMTRKGEKDLQDKRYPDMVEYFTYVGSDTVIKGIRLGDVSSAATFVTVNSHNKDGQVVRQDFYDGKPRKLSATVVNTYDANGWLIKQVHKGGQGEEDLETMYVNDSLGNHVQILPPTVNASMQTKRTFTYDQYGNVTSIVDYPYDMPRRVFCYVYDDHGNWIKQTEYGSPTCHAAHVLFRYITYY